MLSVICPKRKHLVQTLLSTQETCRYENMIGSYLLKVYTVIFVHWMLVCKLIRVNLKPSLSFQVSLVCVFGSLTATILVVITVFYYCVKGKNATIENSLSSHQRRFFVPGDSNEAPSF